MWTDGGQPHNYADMRVYGGGKGGSPAPPPQQAAPPPLTFTDPVDGTTYMSADALNAHVAQRKADEQSKSDLLTQQADTKHAADETTFTNRRDDAANQALLDVARQFQRQGVDPTPYMDTDINPAIARAKASVADLDPDPYAAFTPDLGANIMNSLVTNKRTLATNQINNLFDPSYSTHALDTHLIDPYVSSIVNEQFDPVAGQLVNAQKRGTLTDAGYKAALDALSQKRDAATAQVTSLGQGVLGTQRSALDDYIGGARTAASNLSLAGDFNPDTYVKGAQDLINTDRSGLSGNIRSAVGSTKFVDLTDLLNAGGAAQGTTNPYTTASGNIATGSGPTPAQLAEQELANRKRGLGSTGAF